jgi:hypothetical protein
MAELNSAFGWRGRGWISCSLLLFQAMIASTTAKAPAVTASFELTTGTFMAPPEPGVVEVLLSIECNSKFKKSNQPHKVTPWEVFCNKKPLLVLCFAAGTASGGGG